MPSPENSRSVGGRHGMARCESPCTHPLSQFILSRQSQIIKPNEELGLLLGGEGENSREHSM